MSAQTYPGASAGGAPLSAADAVSISAIEGKRPQKVNFQDIPVSTLTEWDVLAVREALVQHEYGNFNLSGLLGDYMLRDDRIMSSARTRVMGVTSGRLYAAPSPGQTKITPKIAEEYLRIRPRILHTGTEKLLRRWAVMHGFAIGELCWDTSNGKWIPFIKPWHPFTAYYDLLKRCFVVATMNAGPQEIRPGNGKWFIYAPNGLYRGWMEGAVRSCAIPFLLRQYALRDWGRYSEVHGIPQRVGYVPVNASPADKDRFLTQITNLANEGVLLLPKGTDGNDFAYAIVEAAAGNWGAFEALIKIAETGITLAWLGQNLTSQVQDGSLAAATVHNSVRQDFKEDDDASFAADEYNQIIRPWALFNYGDPDAGPMARRDVAPPEDKAMLATTRSGNATAVAQASTALTSLQAIGVNVDVNKFCAKFDIDLNAGGQTTPLKSPVPVASPLGAPKADPFAKPKPGELPQKPSSKSTPAKPVPASKQPPENQP